jgi:transposase
MRTSPYSLDLRKKVINYIKLGNTQKAAASYYELGLNTVNRWYMRYRKEGHYNPRKREGKQGRMCEKALEEFLSKNPNALLKEIGKFFGMTAEGALYWMKKLGYSYKKKASPTWSQNHKNEKNT